MTRLEIVETYSTRFNVPKTVVSNIAAKYGTKKRNNVKHYNHHDRLAIKAELEQYKPTPKRKPAPPRTSSPTLRELFEIQDAAGIPNMKLEDICDTTARQISQYRMGQHTPNIIAVENIGAALGYRLKWEKIK